MCAVARLVKLLALPTSLSTFTVAVGVLKFARDNRGTLRETISSSFITVKVEETILENQITA